jgi:hypothetical protein
MVWPCSARNAWKPAAVNRHFLHSDFSSQPLSISALCSLRVEQRALGLLLSGGDSDQAVNEMGASWPGTSSIVIWPT